MLANLSVFVILYAFLAVDGGDAGGSIGPNDVVIFRVGPLPLPPLLCICMYIVPFEGMQNEQKKYFYLF